MKRSPYILLTVIAAMVVACANLGSPDGGPYDETPPHIVGTTPHYGATHAQPKKIILQFDENIKIQGAMEKVVVSPPQTNQPEIDANGKRITITLNDTLIPNTTYTIDFSDAIEDNNEGNPMGDYAFAFTTGSTLDTMQVSGYVLNAADLEPIKGILVGLYTISNDTTPEATIDPLPDSTFQTRPFERISRTDGSGHFVIKGIPHGHYQVYALTDQDQNYMFSQRSEMIGFNDIQFRPTSRPDMRADTIWHDSIYYDSIVHTPYTHFLPDNLVLLAFREEGQNRSMLKFERKDMERFTFYFTAPDTTLPHISGINFDHNNAFVVEANPTRDTITYWIRDSLIYYKDTLSLAITYNATDSTGQLQPKTDTLDIVSRKTYERLMKERKTAWETYVKTYKKTYKQRRKQQQYDPDADPADDNSDTPDDEEATATTTKKKKSKKGKSNDDDIIVPPMPPKAFEYTVSKTSIAPNQNLTITFRQPVEQADTSMVHFVEVIDSLREERPFLMLPTRGKINQYTFYAEWQPSAKYELLIDSAAFQSIYGLSTNEIKRTISVRSLDTFSTLFLTLHDVDTTAVVQLLNSSDKVIREQRAPNGKADFYFVDPGTYYLRLYLDTNADGQWTTGNYAEHRQAEQMFYYPGSINLRAKWDVSQDWTPTAKPIYQQKPLKITKQKPDRQKQVKSRNAERNKK